MRSMAGCVGGLGKGRSGGRGAWVGQAGGHAGRSSFGWGGVGGRGNGSSLTPPP